MKLTSLAVAAALAGLASAQIPSRPPTWVLNQSTIIVSPLLPCVSPKKRKSGNDCEKEVPVFASSSRVARRSRGPPHPACMAAVVWACRNNPAAGWLRSSRAFVRTWRRFAREVQLRPPGLLLPPLLLLAGVGGARTPAFDAYTHVRQGVFALCEGRRRRPKSCCEAWLPPSLPPSHLCFPLYLPSSYFCCRCRATTPASPTPRPRRAGP
jgi:hypothetical protein